MACAEAGLPCDDRWRGAIAAMFRWLDRFASKTNLIGDADPAAVVADHLIEALVVAAAVDAERGSAPRNVVDVGAGAGLEAQMLALVWPEARVTAVEPREKRAAFIELVADAMGQGRRVRVLRRTLQAARLGAEFDVATSRATFAPRQWLHLAPPLLVVGGQVAVHLPAADVAALAELAGPADPAGLAEPARRCDEPSPLASPSASRLLPAELRRLSLRNVPGHAGHRIGVATRLALDTD